MKQTLVVMLKVPRAGRVKTRLGRDIGMTTAAWWFRHQVVGLLRKVQDPRWSVVLAVAPDAEGMMFRRWPAHLQRVPQGKGHLGARMTAAMRHFHGPVCVIGADIPGITANKVSKAFQSLGQNDAVFGPAPDGGYWLIGVKNGSNTAKNRLDGVRWSSVHALSDSLACFADKRVALVDTLRDVDTADDLP